MSGVTLEDSTLNQILRTTLPGTVTGVALPDWQAVDWNQLIALARLEGLSPLLFRALKDLGAPTPSQQLVQLYIDYSSSARSNLLRFRAACSLLAAFERAQIRAVVLKGAALANSLYDQIGLRTMGDLDLLVRAEDTARAQAIMLESGYVVQPEASAGFREDYGSEQVYVRSDQAGATVEIHWHLFNVPYFRQRVAMEWFWERTVPVQIHDFNAQMFDPDAQLLHLAAHYALHHQAKGMRWLYDIALLLGRSGDAIHWETTYAAADKFGLLPALLHTMDEVVAVWGVQLPSAALEATHLARPTFSERAIFLLLTQPERDISLFWDAWNVPGARNKIIYLTRCVFPDPGYMVTRYQLSSKRALPEAYARRLAEGGTLLARSLGPLIGSFRRSGRVDP